MHDFFWHKFVYKKPDTLLTFSVACKISIFIHPYNYVYKIDIF